MKSFPVYIWLYTSYTVEHNGSMTTFNCVHGLIQAIGKTAGSCQEAQTNTSTFSTSL